MSCLKESCGDCAVWGRVIIIACGVTAIVMTTIAGTSCEFVKFDHHDFEIPVEDNITNMTNITNTTDGFYDNITNDDVYADITNDFGIIKGSGGLFRAQINLESCRSWSKEDQRNFDLRMEIARWGPVGSLICGLIGLFVVWMEFSCCRFGCGRFLECTFYFMAAIGMGLGALMYSSNVCDNPGGPYPCSFGEGTSFAIASFSLYLFCAMLLCVTPKPEPSIVRLKKNEKNDPCCACFKKPEEGEEDGKRDEEQPPPEEEEKQSMFAVFMCWKKKDKKEEEPVEEDGQEEEGSGSVSSDYHESVAEPEEIPQAVLVTDVPEDVQRRVSQRYLDPVLEDEPQVKEAEAAGGWPSFWPRREPKNEPEVSSPDLFFDAAASEGDGGKGNLTAELY